MGKKHRTKKRSQGGEKSGALTAVLIWAAVALAAAALALVIGNLLGDKADGIPSGEEKPPLYEYDGTGAPEINALMIDIDGKSNKEIEAAISKLNDGSDASISLRGDDLKLKYDSEIALAVTGNSGTADLTNAVKFMKDKGLYISACFYTAIASVESASAAEAMSDYESALMLEAISAGVDEIVILGMPTNDTGIAYASSLFKKVRDKAPEAKLGAAFDYTEFSEGRAGYLIEGYLKFADFCALDAKAAFAHGTNAAAVASENLFYFENYPLRVLIADLGKSDRAAQVKALNQLGIYNIQSASTYSAAG
ncbi:MAG: hypothetical protein E7640_01535 [Ruminococcaceae bacterium]|nr:hypothetical protein [Oscillospiraceae bacterium]